LLYKEQVNNKREKITKLRERHFLLEDPRRAGEKALQNFPDLFNFLFLFHRFPSSLSCLPGLREPSPPERETGERGR